MVVSKLVGEIHPESLKEELEMWNHIHLDTQVENRRYNLINFLTRTFFQTLRSGWDAVFKKPTCAAYLNVGFGFVIRNKSDMCFP